MATRKEWAHELAARAKAVGWRATQSRSIGGGYKVWMSPCANDVCNHQMQLHLTSTDVNAKHTAEREMNAHGLDGLEKKLAAKKDQARAARLQADRAAADRRAATLAKRASAINRAAGVYNGPEYVDNTWFTAEHPAPTFKWVTVTPEQADWLLKNCNTDNRPLRRATRDHYVGIIASGQWHQTHQGMAIDTNKVLQDGQHRLSAIAKANVEVVVAFFVGMPPENFKAIDEGLVRTAAQLFGKEGISNPAAVQAVVKMITAYRSGNRDRIRDKLTNELYVDGFEADRDEIQDAVRWGVRKAKQARMTPAALAAARFLLRDANGLNSPYVEGFLRGLATERKLDRRFALEDGDPRLLLHRYIDNTKTKRRRILSGFDQLCLILKTWNHCVQGQTVDYLRWADDDPIPRIVTISPLSHGCPRWLDGEVIDDRDDDLGVVA